MKEIKKTDQLFLQALKASLQQKQVTWESNLTPQEWHELFQMAEKHHVLPMIYEAVFRCPAAQKTDQRIFLPYKQRSVRLVTMQTMKTSEFYMLFQHLRACGVKPLVVKGIICRNLYPKPDYRISGDEDVLIPPDQFERCHQAMLSYGMQIADDGLDTDAVYEVPYGKPGSALYIELHKSLFPPKSDAYGEFNRYFEHVHERAVEISVDGIPVTTMEYTDHLFYLICHAFKHFLHSGFGIRQICDIVLFANTYGKKVEWLWMLEHCREIHADLFTAALFRIGRKYLTFEPEKAGYPEEWQNIRIDETMLLLDLLDAGVYGGGSMSRKHSSNITLNAVSAQKHGKKAGNSVLKTIFLPAKSMERQYPYLKKHPWLLPTAWMSRIWRFYKETKQISSDDAACAIQIGNQRVELLRQYGIMK